MNRGAGCYPLRWGLYCNLLGAHIFSDSLCTICDPVPQILVAKKFHSSLHFTSSDCRPFAAVSQLGCFSCNLLKDIIHKTICDTHCLETNSCNWRYLFQDSVNVCSIVLLPLSLLFISFKDTYLDLHCLFG
jgi:hypothetical protein